ncbi:hypothetical protein PC129_g17391 [Phytophthora cactorum]|nr:hypothetical protein Pcac1_g19062 [Phytophthora cactorum]KAG2804346.1 hypothetical protein PC112_g18762 [Phytophthora cactorum]KAG2805622.1 hypothetical protein PC111_g17724 [Phytophthora cactorum]KAG2842851.1 hypothetical protein PC113_g18732 [Phytophthora cactorum]KAG2894492.1 hypothetical protein PC115_g18124 [Phytophthora cactorum]
MGVVDESGVQTKYITRKKLREFQRIKTKSADEPDFVLVLTKRDDQPGRALSVAA